MPYASPFAPAQIDFSTIGNLADTYYNAKEGAMKRQAFEEDRANARSQRGAASARQARLQEIAKEGFPKDAQGNPDYAAAAARLYEVGEFDKAQQLLGLADKRADSAATRSNQDRQYGLEQERLGLERKRFEREAEKPMHVGDRLVRVGENGPEVYYAPPPDPIDALVAERLGGAGGRPPPATGAVPRREPSGGRVIPQSYQTPVPSAPAVQQTGGPGAAPQLVPGIQLTADGATEEPTTESGTPLADVEERGGTGFNPGDVYNKPGEAMVQTPLGQMSRDEARTLAAGLSKRNPALSRMMIDAAGASPGEMTKTARNQLDKNELNTTEHLSALYAIRESVKPEFLQIRNQAAAFGLNLKEKLGGELTPEDQEFVKGYYTFFSDAASNINQQLKILSGAAVSDQEYKRNLIAAPDPGLKGWFSGDGATAFNAKLDRGIQAQERAIRRQRLLRAQGFTGKPWDAFPLEQTEKRINDYARDLERQIKQQFPNAQPGDIRRAVKDKLKQDIYL